MSEATWKKVVVGRWIKIEKHPDADKLVVCRLDVEPQERTSADSDPKTTNVFEGAYVPVVLSGSRIPGPLHGQPKKADRDKTGKLGE